MTPAPRRLLVELASTLDRVRLLERLNRLLDVISHDCEMPEPVEQQDWRKLMNRERRALADCTCIVLDGEGAAKSEVVARTPVTGAKESKRPALTRMEVVD